MLKFKTIVRNIKLEHIYVILSLVFGLLFVIINGPFQSPDEFAHFYRAYQVSDGKLVCEHYNGQNGAYVPESLIQSDIVQYSQRVPFHTNVRFNSHDIISSLSIPLNKKDIIFISIPNTASYNPIVYLPASIGIGIGKMFNLSPLVLMYMGRICNLVFSITLFYFSIRNIPNKKILLVLFGLMPMLLYQSATLSADSVTNCLAVFLISYFIRLTQQVKENISRKEIIFMFCLVAIVSVTKQVYFVLSLLYFVIPEKKFENKRQYLVIGTLIFLLSIFTNLLWMKVSGAGNVLSTGGVASPKDQVIYVLYHPIFCIKTIIRTIEVNYKFYFQSFIGVLGWLDTILPDYLINSYAFLLIAAGAFSKNEKIIKRRTKVIIVLVAILISLLVILALYVTFTAVGKPIVDGVQGRYFIPSALLILLSFEFKKMENIRYFNVICIVYAIFALSTTEIILFNRYF